jgi:hypothetical protein
MLKNLHVAAGSLAQATEYVQGLPKPVQRALNEATRYLLLYAVINRHGEVTGFQGRPMVVLGHVFSDYGIDEPTLAIKLENPTDLDQLTYATILPHDTPSTLGDTAFTVDLGTGPGYLVPCL